jgi:hypothetical protein
MGIDGTISHFVTLCQEKKWFFNSLGPFVETLNGSRPFISKYLTQKDGQYATL